MAAPTVYHDVAEGVELAGAGQLFAGKKFWVAQRVPMRAQLLDDIKVNGGEIVILEKKADYLIADHLRKDCPVGSTSYEFVDKSIKEGELQDPEDHRAGPRGAREPGAINRPTKNGRSAYTADEDRILYKWVWDAERSGGLASGNEIYKQLEVKHPRHTWQSWRDRYLKHLRGRPPSAFNIPENAPPSPSSDQSNEWIPPVATASRPAQEPAPTIAQNQAVKRASGLGKTRAKDEYSLDELGAMFSSADWEELYAFVDVVDGLAGEERYDTAWTQWAESQANQTAEQWRQYYEKIIRPQWLRDPAWKRAQIKKTVEDRHDGASDTQTQTLSQQNPQDLTSKHTEAPPSTTVARERLTLAHKPLHDDDERFEQLLEAKQENQNGGAYILYARERKWSTWNAQPQLGYDELHRYLMSQWDSLSADDKAVYTTMDEANKRRSSGEAIMLSSELKLLSSSTARHESPKYLTELYEKAMKRIRRNDTIEQEEDGESSRPVKRRKSGSVTPTIDVREPPTDVIGSQKQPLEISSATGTSSTSQSEDEEESLQAQIMEDIASTRLGIQEDAAQEHDQESENATESTESEEFLDIDRILPPVVEKLDSPSEDSFPSNTPTPRAPRQVTNDFDTQAILSSPSQDILGLFARPLGNIKDFQAQTEPRSSSSPPRHPESDASTTQSLMEFRRSLNEEDLSQVAYPQLNSRDVTASPAPSSVSSTGSGDPDPPLDTDEFGDFFDEQYALGFTNDFISKALKRTRLRPGLAVQVLDAWHKSQPLPNQRGVWSLEDDDAVEGGDGVAMARLERKHSMDGWGGITERLLFLEAHRSR